MGKIRKIIVFIALSISCIPAHAQFVLSENDAAGLKWMSIRTAHFQVIYPIGCDSLALGYLKALEAERPRVAQSLGMAANDFNRKPLPVILHTQNASSNGMVTWTPRRMELNTFPEWSGSSAMPWRTMLAIHEGRHAAQMQNGYKHAFEPFYYIFGEMIPGAAAAYPGKLLLEGDAVIAETALSSAGRGRQANFLTPYMFYFDKGEWRDWMRWRIGSYYHYTPDHYALGYLMISGIRTLYDQPLFMADYFNYVNLRPYDPWPLRHAMRRATGKKFKESYEDIVHYHYDIWAADTTARKPFLRYRQVSKTPGHFTLYSNPNSTPEGDYLWEKEDIYHVPRIVKISPDGKEKTLFYISPSAGKMNYEDSDSTLIWNELRRNPRWGQKVKSIVLRYHIPSGKKQHLTHYGVEIYPIEITEHTVAAIRYAQNGEEFIDFINKKNGKLLDSWKIADSLQVVEITHIGTDLYAAGISDKGFGVYLIQRDSLFTLLPPRPVRISALDHDGLGLVFECDMSGVNEYYRLDLPTGRLQQLSSFKYGGIDFSICPNGDLAHTQMHKLGTTTAVTKAEDLLWRDVNWEDNHTYPIAEELSSQEKALAEGVFEPTKYYPLSPGARKRQAKKAEKTKSPADTAKRQENRLRNADADTVISKPERYRKGGHLIHLHSWAPAYVNLDAISDFSMENLKHLASLGLMGFFQNDMSTFSGYVGYKAAPDANSEWFHSGHINLTYKGWWPVFEAEAHINEKKAELLEIVDNKVVATPLDKPLVRGRIRTYVPLKWNTSCLNLGLVPSASFSIDNREFQGGPMMSWSVGINLFVMQHTPISAIYPRWGVGAEAQWFSPLGFFNLYGYLPGICCGQGLRLGLQMEDKVDNFKSIIAQYVNLMPRGFVNAACFNGMKLTADYAIPFPMGDWHISEAFYCTRGILTPHFDYSFIGPVNDLSGEKSVYSVGATFEMEFGAFFWIRTPITIGVTYSYNDGPLAARVLSGASPHYVGATFNIALPN